MDSVFSHQRVAQLATPIAFNSTIRDLQNLSNIEREAWYGVSEGSGLVPGTTAGFEEEVTGGFGRDPEKADAALAGQQPQLVDAYEERFGDGSPPFAFLFLGLGGGTGCGIAPHLAEAIREYGGSSTDIIAVAVLPNTAGQVTGDDGPSATRQATNAIYGLDRLEEHVDGVILIDNQRLAYEDAAEGGSTSTTTTRPRPSSTSSPGRSSSGSTPASTTISTHLSSTCRTWSRHSRSTTVMSATRRSADRSR
ncbi:hypothetical protein ACFQFH_00685 [Halobaculum halobium]|uniref:Tubulin/FtsZ GTPase domain-containing protein n=1 Tax=Halobaculum halobium TaxID=3032281 RepID=A0ABD5T5X9_9EURY|nr:hypothetical protein [Halobaculum sp. SYNS20]